MDEGERSDVFRNLTINAWPPIVPLLFNGTVNAQGHYLLTNCIATSWKYLCRRDATSNGKLERVIVRVKCVNAS